MNTQSFLSWSGGKDSSLSLHKAREQGLPVTKLLTTVNAEHRRISAHGVRTGLLTQQAAAIGLPLQIVSLPGDVSMQVYEEAMNESYAQLRSEGFTGAVFGDIFLEDLKIYRQQQLAKAGFTCFFPLWKGDSRRLMQDFLLLGFKAIVVCVNMAFLDKRFCGRLIDASFVADLPDTVDVCGENGEYHSFVFDGPVFHRRCPFKKAK